MRKCQATSCVEINEMDGGYAFTSSVPGNDGRVVYTRDEVAQLLADVKAGKWDDLHRRVRGPKEPSAIA